MQHKYSGSLFGFKLIVFLLSIISFHFSRGQAQPYSFKQFALPKDLPPIGYLYEDHFGYIWLGTNEGLYRFDGIQYKYYGAKDEVNGLGREVITCIMEDHQQNLWVGARTGLYRYDPQKKDFENFSFTDELYPHYLHQENDSCFLVKSLIGIFLFYPSSSRWEKLDVGIHDNEIFAAQRGQNNDLWIGTHGLVRKYDIEKKTLTDFHLPIPSYAAKDEKISVANLFLDSREQLWINTWYKGVMKLDSETGQIQSFDTLRAKKNNYLYELFHPSIREDGDGNIWLGSEVLGISVYHPKEGIITHIPKDINDAFGLTGSYFFIMADRKNNMWVKSDKALHYLSRDSPVMNLKSDGKSEIPVALFISFLHPDYALIGTYFGLYSVNTETMKTHNLSATLQLPATHNAEFQAVPDVLIQKNVALWFTSPQGLRKVTYTQDEQGEPQFRFDKLYSTKSPFWPSKCFAINDSTIIVKGRTNTTVFASFNSGAGIFDYHVLPDTMMINQAIHYQGDTIILAVRNKGLYYYHVTEKSLHPIAWKFDDPTVRIRKPVFLKIALLHDGRYGICTENFGLLIYDPVRNIFQRIDVAQLSNSNRVYSVDEDAKHNLWIQTPNQLLYFNIQYQSLSKIDLSNSFNGENPYYFFKNGKELYCTYEGDLVYTELDQLFTKTEKPKLYLQSILARDRQLDWQSSGTMRLDYSDNFLTYEYIGLDYENPHGISYWYKIPEISDVWIPAGNHTSISMGRLSPGTYNLSIKASNDAGLWSEEIQAPEIRITPPFWKKWWVILGLVAVLTGIAAYFLWLIKAKKESEMKLRNQIAKDLHDDIGSTLSGIKIFSNIASDIASGNAELSPLLQQISEKSDLMMQSMSDIVWSINPEHDSLHDMMIRLKTYMNEILEVQNISVDLKSDVDLKNTRIDLKHRKELYLALKEIINNVAKHASCSNLIFHIKKEKGRIVFFLKDDGIGMNERDIVFGNGLRNVDARIRQIDGHVSRESSPGNGTSYEITVSSI